MGKAALAAFSLRLQQHGLVWADALPLFETIDSLEEIQEAIADPAEFLATATAAGGALGKKLALAKARPALEPKSRRAFAGVAPFSQSVCSPDS